MTKVSTERQMLESLARIEHLLTNRIPRLDLVGQMTDTILPHRGPDYLAPRLRVITHPEGITFELSVGYDLVWSHHVGFWS